MCTIANCCRLSGPSMAMPHAPRTALPAPSQASNHDEVTASAASSSSAEARCDTVCVP